MPTGHWDFPIKANRFPRPLKEQRQSNNKEKMDKRVMHEGPFSKKKMFTLLTATTLEKENALTFLEPCSLASSDKVYERIG